MMDIVNFLRRIKALSLHASVEELDVEESVGHSVIVGRVFSITNTIEESEPLKCVRMLEECPMHMTSENKEVIDLFLRNDYTKLQFAIGNLVAVNPEKVSKSSSQTWQVSVGFVDKKLGRLWIAPSSNSSSETRASGRDDKSVRCLKPSLLCLTYEWFSSPLIPKKAFSKSLKDVPCCDTYNFNLTCKVLSMHTISKNYVVVRVTDGTLFNQPVVYFDGKSFCVQALMDKKKNFIDIFMLEADDVLPVQENMVVKFCGVEVKRFESETGTCHCFRMSGDSRKIKSLDQDHNMKSLINVPSTSKVSAQKLPKSGGAVHVGSRGCSDPVKVSREKCNAKKKLSRGFLADPDIMANPSDSFCRIRPLRRRRVSDVEHTESSGVNKKICVAQPENVERRTKKALTLFVNSRRLASGGEVPKSVAAIQDSSSDSELVPIKKACTGFNKTNIPIRPSPHGAQSKKQSSVETRTELSSVREVEQSASVSGLSQPEKRSSAQTRTVGHTSSPMRRYLNKSVESQRSRRLGRSSSRAEDSRLDSKGVSFFTSSEGSNLSSDEFVVDSPMVSTVKIDGGSLQQRRSVATREERSDMRSEVKSGAAKLPNFVGECRPATMKTVPEPLNVGIQSVSRLSQPEKRSSAQTSTVRDTSSPMRRYLNKSVESQTSGRLGRSSSRAADPRLDSKGISIIASNRSTRCTSSEESNSSGAEFLVDPPMVSTVKVDGGSLLPSQQKRSVATREERSGTGSEVRSGVAKVPNFVGECRPATMKTVPEPLNVGIQSVRDLNADKQGTRLQKLDNDRPAPNRNRVCNLPNLGVATGPSRQVDYPGVNCYSLPFSEKGCASSQDHFTDNPRISHPKDYCRDKQQPVCSSRVVTPVNFSGRKSNDESDGSEVSIFDDRDDSVNQGPKESTEDSGTDVSLNLKISEDECEHDSDCENVNVYSLAFSQLPYYSQSYHDE